MDPRIRTPDRLLYLIEHEHWPTEDKHFLGQDFKQIIDEDLVQAVFPTERRFCFAKPPFPLISQLKSEHDDFWGQEYARPDQIVPELSLIIGDFEIGTDSAVILDYTESFENPRVRWLRHIPHNEWITACQSFDEFANRLQLEQLHFPPLPIPWWKSLLSLGGGDTNNSEQIVAGKG